MNTIKGEKINKFEEIQDISRNKDALSVWATSVMQPVTSSAGDRIYLKLIVTGKGARNLLIVVAQVWFALAGFLVICSQDCARRIFSSLSSVRDKNDEDPRIWS